MFAVAIVVMRKRERRTVVMRKRRGRTGRVGKWD